VAVLPAASGSPPWDRGGTQTVRGALDLPARPPGWPRLCVRPRSAGSPAGLGADRAEEATTPAVTPPAALQDELLVLERVEVMQAEPGNSRVERNAENGCYCSGIAARVLGTNRRDAQRSGGPGACKAPARVGRRARHVGRDPLEREG